MPSPEQLLNEVNRHCEDSRSAGMEVGTYTIGSYDTQPLDFSQSSHWTYFLGELIDEGLEGPPQVLEKITEFHDKIPESVRESNHELDVMYDDVLVSAERSTRVMNAAAAFRHRVLSTRILGATEPLWHPHFGDVPLGEFRPKLSHSLPLPQNLCNQFGARIVEWVTEPETETVFPIRNSFLYAQSLTPFPTIHQLSLNRRIDETWPDTLLQHVDQDAVALWDNTK